MHAYIKTDSKTFPRTKSILDVINQAEIRLNALRCKFPSGFKSIDNETETKIAWLTQYILNVKGKIKK